MNKARVRHQRKEGKLMGSRNFRHGELSTRVLLALRKAERAVIRIQTFKQSHDGRRSLSKVSCSNISNLFVHREKVVNSRWSLTRGVAYTRYNTVLAFFVNEK